MKRKRTKKISNWLRDYILMRDKYRCFYCGISVIKSKTHCNHRAHIDHLIPLNRNGSNDFWNLVTSCALCNIQKDNKTVDEFRAFFQKRLAGLVNLYSENRELDQYSPCSHESGSLDDLVKGIILANNQALIMNDVFKFKFYGEEIRRQALYFSREEFGR